MKNSIILFSLLILLAGCLSNSEPTTLDLNIPKHYVVHKTTGDLNINGIAGETDWSHAEWTDLFMDIEGNTKPAPYFDTRVKMLWDEDYLYFYAELMEDHIWGDITERDAVIFYNNDFEVFVKPNELYPHYAEFEINALGTLWELILLRPYRIGGPVSNYWDVNGTQIGIHINGTLNDPSDTDTSWTVEMAIPLQALADLNRGNKVGEGTTWRLNFSRVQWEHNLIDGNYQRKKDPDTGDYLPEYNWVWSPQYVINMHEPEHWGYLQFTQNNPAQQKAYSPDLWAMEYQLLFYLYRRQLTWKNEHGDYAKNLNHFGGPDFTIRDTQYHVSIINTNAGYELSVFRPSKGTLTLNNEGYLSIIQN